MMHALQLNWQEFDHVFGQQRPDKFTVAVIMDGVRANVVRALEALGLKGELRIIAHTPNGFRTIPRDVPTFVGQVCAAKDGIPTNSKDVGNAAIIGFNFTKQAIEACLGRNEGAEVQEESGIIHVTFKSKCPEAIIELARVPDSAH